ncbi:glycoside hydrolase family 5 protein [Anaerosporobacter faecicola]|uniref:glycoside hydrolase family 5 protein n=1 Tax=Anaerosporobacter faecicola TaxID=2718714 RepID=UPI00143B6C8E|nr:cellulase family glycosylhydrolase [Anaerosporobacter faecicola]
MEFIKVVGKHFCYKGEKIRLRGFGVGTWLNLEHFMFGIPTSDQMIQSAFETVYGKEGAGQFFKVYRDSFLGEKDFQLLKACGVNFIRVPFNYRLFINDNGIGEWKEEGFRCFDRLFALGKKYEIFIMPDLHTTPGAQNPDWHSDNSYGVPLFWKYQVLRRQMTKLWGAIAARYSEEPYLMGYDLLNEPAMANWDCMNEFYEETIEEIRKVDKNHVIVLEGDQFSMDFSGLKHFDDSQIALGFHYYPTVWHPNLLERDLDRKERMKQIANGLDQLVQIREQFGCPAFCGEYGYGADCGEPEYTIELVKDTMELMEEREIDWLLWCYKDAHFMSLISPTYQTNWMKLVSQIQKEWTQDIEKEQAGKLLDEIAEKDFTQITEEERYLLQFRLRAALYVLQRNHVVIPKLQKIPLDNMLSMAKDFAYENCEIYENMKVLMQQVLR